MKNVVTPKDVWEQTFTCENCHTIFTAETSDIQYGGFKKPGTYWFDGSADAAGVDRKFYVECPEGCSEVFFVPEEEVHIKHRKELVAQYNRRGW